MSAFSHSHNPSTSTLTAGFRLGTSGALAPTSSNGASRPKSANLVPTNSITTKDGVTVRARIDPTLTVDEVIKSLCLNLKIKDPAVMFALRDETDELVTNDNLRKKIKSKVGLKLVNAPALEAAEIVEKLSMKDDKTLRLTLFSLQKFIREGQFASEFLQRDGLRELLDVINISHGNTLAYALSAMQNLMDLDRGWSNLDNSFISTIVQILSSPQSLINVCRPATAILKKLVEADPLSAPGPVLPSTSRSPPSAPPGSVYRYGFDVVYGQMRKEKGLLETVVTRLGSADTAMVLYSMMLINSLLSHATDARWEEFIGELERLNVRKAVIRLMSSHTIEDLTSCILDFQVNMVRVTYRKKTSPVEPDVNPAHYDALEEIWHASKLEEHVAERQWSLLGFASDNMYDEFGDVGVLGLNCLKQFSQRDSEFFSEVVLEQLGRAEERRCPVARASNEVVELLLEHWAIFAPGYSTSTTFQPFFLNFYKVHALALKFFLHMWTESGSSVDDFPRIVALTRSQLHIALNEENSRAWHEVENDFLEAEYRAVRDRQMKELEEEDDFMTKVPVRNLRAKLYKESYEFVRQQRLQCLMQGAWFVNAIPLSSPVPKDTDNGMKYIHFCDSSAKFPVRNGLEDLPERIDISQISEIATGTCAAPPHVLRDQNDLPPPTPLTPSPLSFSVLNAAGESLADQIAPDQSRWADWTDALQMLRKDGGHMASQETAGFVQALTEIGLKIKLLDLTGEKVDIPSGLVAGPPPNNTDFFFSDLDS
ncbi:hypothetical protein JAAARDRAFT_190152 [Jaapia argillacea MUCL 33604]|uniref:ELMO domain-containing protein n=1 Tax=Jaapia argillacea MUCL 33604 TaxID=933084 RepID=A0A067QCY3_9AGAM|nr:hypothetical protein JAAARDRAFT_190152 [Jaapia argillacea MUCL 33604]